jgi:hypothetical protein
MTALVGTLLQARPRGAALGHGLAARWRLPFRSPLAPRLVLADEQLLLADGAGSLRALHNTHPGEGFAGWPCAPLPSGAFRPSAGPPLFVAEGGTLLQVRGDLSLKPIVETGVADDSLVQAIGLDDGSVIAAADGRVWRVNADSSLGWGMAGGWVPRLAQGEHLIATQAPDQLLLLDARSGALRQRISLNGMRPFALAGDRLWLHGPQPELVGLALDGAATITLPLAAPAPRPLLNAQGQAVVLGGRLAVQMVDLVAGRVTQTHRFDAPQAWPLLLTDDGRVFCRDEQGALRWFDTAPPASSGVLHQGQLFSAAQAHEQCLFVLEESLDDRQAAVLHCFSTADRP